MAHISTNEDGLTVISLGNKLEVLDPTTSNSSTPLFIFTNTLDTSDTDSNDSNFIQHLHSPNKSHIAAITGNKKLLLWDVGATTTTEPVCFVLPKRPTCLCFCNRSATVLVGDKSGDVYRCEFGDEGRVSQLLLGHLSMVLDVVVSHDDRFVVSADRDEKIRVSRYPNAYNIHTFCLGHQQLVSTMLTVRDDRLVSGGGDATVRLWDFQDGREVARCATSAWDAELKVVSKVSYSDGEVAVIGEQCTSVLLLSCSGDDLKHQQTFALSAMPYDMCFRSGKLLVLVNDVHNPLVCLQKVDGVYTQTSVSLSVSSLEAGVGMPADTKTYTDLLKFDSAKRLSIGITPEATINNVVIAEEKSSNNQNTLPQLVSMES